MVHYNVGFSKKLRYISLLNVSTDVFLNCVAVTKGIQHADCQFDKTKQIHCSETTFNIEPHIINIIQIAVQNKFIIIRY